MRRERQLVGVSVALAVALLGVAFLTACPFVGVADPEVKSHAYDGQDALMVVYENADDPVLSARFIAMAQRKLDMIKTSDKLTDIDKEKVEQAEGGLAEMLESVDDPPFLRQKALSLHALFGSINEYEQLNEEDVGAVGDLVDPDEEDPDPADLDAPDPDQQE